MLINLDPRKNLLFKESNKEKIPLRWLLISMIELLIDNHYLDVMFSKERW